MSPFNAEREKERTGEPARNQRGWLSCGGYSPWHCFRSRLKELGLRRLLLFLAIAAFVLVSLFNAGKLDRSGAAPRSGVGPAQDPQNCSAPALL